MVGDELFAFFIGAIVGLVIMLLMVISFSGVPLFSHEKIAVMICESHGMELDYFEGSIDKVVCRKPPRTNPDQTVFDFGD